MTGVYILLKGFDVIYIGQSVNMERRMKDHFLKDYDGYVLIPSDDRGNLERYLIDLIKPSDNKYQTGIKKVHDMYITNLRINPELADKVKSSAEAAKRSMNKEIELALEQRYVSQ